MFYQHAAPVCDISEGFYVLLLIKQINLDMCYFGCNAAASLSVPEKERLNQCLWSQSMSHLLTLSDELHITSNSPSTMNDLNLQSKKIESKAYVPQNCT